MPLAALGHSPHLEAFPLAQNPQVGNTQHPHRDGGSGFAPETKALAPALRMHGPPKKTRRRKEAVALMELPRAAAAEITGLALTLPTTLVCVRYLWAG